MTKVLKFRVEIEGLENKIWREIEITDRKTVADLAYAILTFFESLAYHLYSIEYKDTIYDCWVAIEDYHGFKEHANAVVTKLNTINFDVGDKMTMEYDIGSPTTFIITYLGKRDFEKGNGMHYPRVIDGAGSGMIDDISGFELKDIVEDIDKKGVSNHFYTPRYRGYSRPYDYRDFDIQQNNLRLRRYFWKIKAGYENEE